MTTTDVIEEVSRFSGMNLNAADQTSIAGWVKGGLLLMNRTANWSWLRTELTWELLDDVYATDLRAIEPTAWRVDTQSFYRDDNEALSWATLTQIDQWLLPTWKDASTSGSTPQFITRKGVQLWVAPKPDQAITLYGAGWRTENIDEDEDVNGGHLLVPDEFFDAVVECALAYGYHEEDDARAEVFLNHFRAVHLPDMLAFNDVGHLSSMRLPRLSPDQVPVSDGYGGYD